MNGALARTEPSISRTSSAIDGAFGGDALENASAFLVVPGVAAEDAVFEHPTGLGRRVKTRGEAGSSLWLLLLVLV